MNLLSCMYFSPSAKPNQTEDWPKLWSLLKLLLLRLNWTDYGCWRYKPCNLWVWFVIQFYVRQFSHFHRLSFSKIGEMVRWCHDETEVWTKVVDGVIAHKYWMTGLVCCARHRVPLAIHYLCAQGTFFMNMGEWSGPYWASAAPPLCLSKWERR